MRDKASNLLEEASELESMASYNTIRLQNKDVDFLLDRAASLRSQANDLVSRKNYLLYEANMAFSHFKNFSVKQKSYYFSP